ncbi:AMP-binding protein [Streptomyces sp. A1136]|uniref:AMP-binding protein n=1 Tax=Streptomyces sp. A1136 TaxID=2563102 RepID=UPI001F1037FB|nr:AMP-binding protein [Streptomyces sp. A1136]
MNRDEGAATRAVEPSIGPPDVAGALAAITPPPDVAAAFRAQGWWRADTFIDDLRRTAARHPRRTALVSHRPHRPVGRRDVVLDYARLAAYVERFAAALAALGIREGDPVAYQLPDRWETAALTLACMRLGAVAVPVLPTVRSRGLARILTASQARVCVVPDVWDGYPHAEALARIAAGLPWLRHQVVAAGTERAGAGAGTGRSDVPDGTVDFHDHFLRTAHERGPHGRRPPPSPGAADRICLMVTVMGVREDRYTTTLHTPNTLYANISGQDDRTGPGRRPGEVFFSALPLTSLASILYAVCWPLAVGGSGVYQELWSPDGCLDLLETAGVHQAYAAPAQWSEVLAAQLRRPRTPDSLRLVLSGGRTGTAAPLPAALADALGGAAVRMVWGAPELGMGTLTRGDTPAERDGASDGMPLAGLEVSPLLRGHGAHPEESVPLRVRGPSVCLATWAHGAPAPVATWEDAEGWVDTGDRGQPDGLGGIQVTARATTRTGGLFLVPVDRIERELRAHPGVREAVVLGHTDPDLGERPCAVVVPEAEDAPPGLLELREHLTARGVGEGFLPIRLELVGSLPRDDRGELLRDGLRAWLERLRPGMPRLDPRHEGPTGQ